MAATPSSAIIRDIDAHMTKSGIPNGRWYVGVTSDIERRLFGFHAVSRQKHWFIYRQAVNSAAARDIENAYHKAGCQGAGGGGDLTARYVYAYVITPTTVE
jgi:hypothetical protein